MWPFHLNSSAETKIWLMRVWQFLCKEKKEHPWKTPEWLQTPGSFHIKRQLRDIEGLGRKTSHGDAVSSHRTGLGVGQGSSLSEQLAGVLTCH